MKKYYIAARHIGAAIGRNQNADCMHDTIGEAIDEARERMMDSDSERCYAIVKVVRIVKRAKPPIEVIEVD